MKVELVDHMGSDLSVVNAARVSFDKTSDWCRVSRPVTDDGDNWNIEETKVLSLADTRLIKYLATHDHWTPFAHTAVTLRMQAPVPIRTQCFKHKQGLVENEESRRYISGTPEVYVPDVWRKAPDSAKQGSGGPTERQPTYHLRYEYAVDTAISCYNDMVAFGVCPEQARFVLPQGCMVNWIWTGNLYAFANFFNKRTYAYAQQEVRDLALLVGAIIEPLFPVSWKALANE